MAAFRRAVFDASKLLKQGSTAVRKCSRTVIQTQARTLMAQQSLLLKRSNVEMIMAKQAQQSFASIPRIMSSAVLAIIPAVDTDLLTTGSSGSSEVEGSLSDEEGLVTPALDPVEDV